MKLSKQEKARARLLGVSSADVHRTSCNSCGAVWGLYNNYYLTEITTSGRNKAEIYRLLLRKLIKQVDL